MHNEREGHSERTDLRQGQMPYLSMVTKAKHNSQICPVIWILETKIELGVTWPMLQPSTKFQVSIGQVVFA